MIQDARVYSMMVKVKHDRGYPAGRSRAKFDHDLIMSITKHIIGSQLCAWSAIILILSRVLTCFRSCPTQWTFLPHPHPQLKVQLHYPRHTNLLPRGAHFCSFCLLHLTRCPRADNPPPRPLNTAPSSEVILLY